MASSSSASRSIPMPAPAPDLNFSFSPSSPPAQTSYVPVFDSQAHNTSHPFSPSPFPSPLPQSSISPSLFNSSSISGILAAGTGRAAEGVRESSPMDEDGAASGAHLSANQLGKRPATIDEGAEEDALRRGPPTSDTPGGDCKSLCVRHQRMANGGTNLMLQKVTTNSTRLGHGHKLLEMLID